MSLLEVKRAGEGQCVLCGTHKPGVDVSFHDKSLNGWLCFTHFKKLVLTRGEVKDASKAGEPKGAEK